MIWGDSRNQGEVGVSQGGGVGGQSHDRAKLSPAVRSHTGIGGVVAITASRPSDRALAELLDRLPDRKLTYLELGATRDADLPSGYRHDRYSVALGDGDATFPRGQEALRSWQAHLHAGATVIPAHPPIVVGTNMVVTIRLGPAFAIAPCRIVYVSDNEESFGFAYGTLPGHPERGEGGVSHQASRRRQGHLRGGGVFPSSRLVGPGR
jgi:uncharacterized protein (UPF0548 family)